MPYVTYNHPWICWLPCISSAPWYTCYARRNRPSVPAYHITPTLPAGPRKHHACQDFGRYIYTVRAWRQKTISRAASSLDHTYVGSIWWGWPGNGRREPHGSMRRIISDAREQWRIYPVSAPSVLSPSAAVPSVRRRGPSALSGRARARGPGGCVPRTASLRRPDRRECSDLMTTDHDADAKARSAGGHRSIDGSGPVVHRRPIDRRRKQISGSSTHPVHALGRRRRRHTHFPCYYFSSLALIWRRYPQSLRVAIYGVWRKIQDEQSNATGS